MQYKLFTYHNFTPNSPNTFCQTSQASNKVSYRSPILFPFLSNISPVIMTFAIPNPTILGTPLRFNVRPTKDSFSGFGIILRIVFILSTLGNLPEFPRLSGSYPCLSTLERSLIIFNTRELLKAAYILFLSFPLRTAQFLRWSFRFATLYIIHEVLTSFCRPTNLSTLPDLDTGQMIS